MSAIGTKRTILMSPIVVRFGGKADIELTSECPQMTQSGHRLSPAAVVLMPVSAPIEVLV